MRLGAAARIRRNPNVVTRRQAGEVLLVPIRNDMAEVSGMLYLLPNEVSIRIWEHLAQESTFDRLVEAIEAEYEADRESVTRDVSEYLEQLQSIGAIVIS